MNKLLLRQMRNYIEGGQNHSADSLEGKRYKNAFPNGTGGAAIDLLISLTHAASTQARLPDIQPTDAAHIFTIDGRQFVAPRQSPALWLFYMAMRDGWSDARWMFDGGDPAKCADNSRRRVVSWLDREGFRDLANQVRRCRLSGSMVIYSCADTWDMRG